jgi:soluble lytic murein transglycosylase
VGSPAGAKVLMQLMPGTAKDVCKELGIAYRPQSLSDPDYNVRLGTTFIQKQIDSFDGSYVLALAGYNAGPRRARQWIDLFGDPRTANVDAIDWIELIPIYETRNYVQRIIENLQFYRAKLNGGQAPLLIMQDLKR